MINTVSLSHSTPPPALSRRYNSFKPAKSDTMSIRTQNPRFNGYTKYHGPYTGVNFINDFNDGISTLEAKGQFHATLSVVQKDYRTFRKLIDALEGSNQRPGILKRFVRDVVGGLKWQWNRHNPFQKDSGFLEVNTEQDIPYGDTNYSSLGIHRIAGRPNKQILIHVTDPGVGNDIQNNQQQHNRSILVTRNYGIAIGPNNGSLGLLIRSLLEKNEPFELLPIDLNKVQAFERVRLNDPTYDIPDTFHARDVFAPVAAAIAGGIDPHYFADLSRLNTFKPVFSTFSERLPELPAEIGKPTSFVAIKDRTFGNLKTNLVVLSQQLKELRNKDAQFQITGKHLKTGEKLSLTIPFKSYFSQVPKGDPLIYQGSSHTPYPNSRFLELARNLDTISSTFGLEYGESIPLTIQRVE